jgi:hypothetical protein
MAKSLSYYIKVVKYLDPSLDEKAAKKAAQSLLDEATKSESDMPGTTYITGSEREYRKAMREIEADKPQEMPSAGGVIGRVPTPTPTKTVTASGEPTPTETPAAGASNSNFATNIVSRAASQGVTIDVNFTPKAVDFWSTLDDKELTAIASYLKKLGKPVKSRADLLDTISAYFPEAYKATNIESVIGSLKDQIILGFSGDASTGGPKLPTQQIQQVDPAVINAVIRTVYQNRFGRNETPDELAADFAIADKMIKEGQVATTKVVGGKTQTTYTPGFSQARLEESIGKKLETTTDPSLQQDYLEKQSIDFIDFLTKMKG